MKRFLLSLVALVLLTAGAEAACTGGTGSTCFWVGGSGTWDNSSTAHWSNTSGGASGAGPPSSTESATFDASSGGGTVTVASTINGSNTLVTITMGAFTGTLDFSVNNPSITLTTQFSITGTGTRDIKTGTGTFTFTGVNTNNWDATTTTNCTCASLGSATYVLSTGGSQGQTFAGGGKSYGTLTINGRNQIGTVTVTGSNTFATINTSGPLQVNFSGGTTQTLTNAINWAQSPSTTVVLTNGGSSSKATLSLSAAPTAVSWMGFKGIASSGVGAAFTATNSSNYGGNSGFTISTPSSGGGGIIGG